MGVISSLSWDDSCRCRCRVWFFGSLFTAAILLKAFFFFLVVVRPRLEPRFDMDCDWGTRVPVFTPSQLSTKNLFMKSSNAAISSRASWNRKYKFYVKGAFKNDVTQIWYFLITLQPLTCTYAQSLLLSCPKTKSRHSKATEAR